MEHSKLRVFAKELAAQYGVHRNTITRWKKKGIVSPLRGKPHLRPKYRGPQLHNPAFDEVFDSVLYRDSPMRMPRWRVPVFDLFVQKGVVPRWMKETVWAIAAYVRDCGAEKAFSVVREGHLLCGLRKAPETVQRFLRGYYLTMRQERCKLVEGVLKHGLDKRVCPSRVRGKVFRVYRPEGKVRTYCSREAADADFLWCFYFDLTWWSKPFSWDDADIERAGASLVERIPLLNEWEDSDGHAFYVKDRFRIWRAGAFKNPLLPSWWPKPFKKSGSVFLSRFGPNEYLAEDSKGELSKLVPKLRQFTEKQRMIWMAFCIRRCKIDDIIYTELNPPQDILRQWEKTTAKDVCDEIRLQWNVEMSPAACAKHFSRSKCLRGFREEALKAQRVTRRKRNESIVAPQVQERFEDAHWGREEQGKELDPLAYLAASVQAQDPEPSSGVPDGFSVPLKSDGVLVNFYVTGHNSAFDNVECGFSTKDLSSLKQYLADFHRGENQKPWSPPCWQEASWDKDAGPRKFDTIVLWRDPGTGNLTLKAGTETREVAYILSPEGHLWPPNRTPNTP